MAGETRPGRHLTLGVAMSAGEWESLADRSRICGVSMAEYVRQQLFGGKPRLTREERKG